MMSEGQKEKGNPKQTAVRILSETYDQLEKKDMPKEQFINECLGVMIDKKKRKNSPLILPGD